MTTRRCKWCPNDVPPDARLDSKFCSQPCRQAAFRVRHRYGMDGGKLDRPLRFAYADPPYPGTSARYYGRERSFAGEVDHEQLVAALSSGNFDGWALSTSATSLRELLPLCPATARVVPWVKPIGVPRRSFGPHCTWEPLIFVPGRTLRPGFRDFLSAQPAKRGGTLHGRKPLAFCAFLFRCLGMLPGDELVDCFPGTGIVGRAWRELSPLEERRIRQSAARDDSSRGLGRRVAAAAVTVVVGAYRFMKCCGAPLRWDEKPKHFEACTGAGLDPKHVVGRRRSSTGDTSVRA